MLSFHFRNGVPGAPADFLLTGKICLGNFFLISKSPFLGGVFFSEIFYPPLRELCNAPLWGPIWFSFFFISSLRSLFWVQNPIKFIAFFDLPIFYHPEGGPIKDPYGFPNWDLSYLSPVAGANVMLPYGVPFDSLSFLYLTSGHFFDFKN